MFNPEDWIQRISEVDVDTESTSHQLLFQELMDVSFSSRRTGDRSTIDRLLGLIDPNKVHHMYSLGALRATFAYHQSLQNWTLLRDRTVNALYYTLGPREFHGLLDTSWFSQHPGFDRLIGTHPSLIKSE